MFPITGVSSIIFLAFSSLLQREQNVVNTQGVAREGVAERELMICKLSTM